MRIVVTEGSFKIVPMPDAEGGIVGFGLEIEDPSGATLVAMMGAENAKALGESLVAAAADPNVVAAPPKLTIADGSLARGFRKGGAA
jgi:hypothetical protein